MTFNPCIRATITLIIVLVITGPIAAQDSNATSNRIFSVTSRINSALLMSPQIQNSANYQAVKAMTPTAFTGKTHKDVFKRGQRLTLLVNKVRQDAGMSTVTGLTTNADGANTAQAYLSVANSLDALVAVIAKSSSDDSWRDLNQATHFTDKTDSDAYSMVDLAVSRLETHYGLASTALAPVTKSSRQRVLATASEPNDNTIATASVTTRIPSKESVKRTNVRLSIAPLVSAEPAPARAPLRYVAQSGQTSPAIARTSRLNVEPPPIPTRRHVRSTAQPTAVVAAAEPKSVISAGMVNTTKPAKGEAQEGINRPKKGFLRQNEDWSVLAGATDDQKTDWWDSIKYVPLNDDGSVWASFGGQARLRLEDWNDFAFGAPADADDTFLLWRLMLHADVHFGENVRVYVEGKSALLTDRELPGGRRAAVDSDSLALQQAFADVKISTGDGSVTIRGGRQMFLFGKQRLVSPLPWANNLRAWDGISAITNIGEWKFHGFYSHFVPVRKHDFNQEDAQTEFYGVYANGKIFDDKIKMDAYFLGLEKEGPITFNGTSGSEDRYTIGVRLSGKIGETAFDYDVEGAYQFGEVGTADIAAYMFASEISYKAADLPGAPRFKLGFDYASGDKTAGDSDVETFNQLFPLGHAYYGFMDFVGRQNAIDLSPGVTFTAMDKMTISATGHLFWRAENADALYNAGGGVVRGGGLGSDNEIGSEIDLTLKYKFDSHLMGLLGYSHFFTGDFLEESGSSDDMDFIYAQMQYTF